MEETSVEIERNGWTNGSKALPSLKLVKHEVYFYQFRCNKLKQNNPFYLIFKCVKKLNLEGEKGNITSTSLHLQDSKLILQTTMSRRQNLKIFTIEEIKNYSNNFNTIQGSGNFSQVFEGAIEEKPIAIKVSQDRRQYEVEKEKLMEFNHPNIIQLLGICEQGHKYILVLELMKADFAQMYLDLKWKETLQILKQVARAVQYIHGYNFDVIDLKPANILLDENKNSKLCDFGALTKIGMTPTVMTEAYMAPEYLHMGKASHQGDIYSFGIMLIQILMRVKEEEIRKTKEREENRRFDKKGKKKSVVHIYHIAEHEATKSKSKHYVHQHFLDTGCDEKIARDISDLALQCAQWKVERRISSIDEIISKLDNLGLTVEESNDERKSGKTSRQTAKGKRKK